MTKTTGWLALAASLSATTSMAGGIDRSALGYGILFQDGRTVEFNLMQVTPNVKGTYVARLGGGSTGNMAQSYSALSFGFKDDITDKLSYAIVLGQPIGADAKYTGGPYTGLEAHWRTEELTALLKYRIDGGASVFGGLRYLNSSANIVIPPALVGSTYTARTASDAKLGYIVGAAYEKPEIALRVALTYTSEVTHNFNTTEQHPAITGGAPLTSVTDIVLPQTLTLDAQTGIAADTLLFGSIRWAQWSRWHVKPVGYSGLSRGQEITGFGHDVITYTLGLGRKINDHLSVFGALGYERATGGVASRLAPTDGMKSISLGAVWTEGKAKITAGVQYQMLGNAVDGSGTRFTGNSVLGVGIKVAYSF
ncbi:MAG: hypothetical protein B7Y02_03550 [Rhodobacterales bacterium 17-64-5]|nr:MAG: hypothetical protein B7Y02_03550 [Rhodobacterales bacterium 17-64-5]